MRWHGLKFGTRWKKCELGALTFVREQQELTKHMLTHQAAPQDPVRQEHWQICWRDRAVCVCGLQRGSTIPWHFRSLGAMHCGKEPTHPMLCRSNKSCLHACCFERDWYSLQRPVSYQQPALRSGRHGFRTLKSRYLHQGVSHQANGTHSHRHCSKNTLVNTDVCQNVPQTNSINS